MGILSDMVDPQRNRPDTVDIAKAVARSRTAWLVERADPRNPGCVLPNSFLGVRGCFDGFYGRGTLYWASSAKDALRFARLEDAAMFIGAMAVLMGGLPHRETLPGLCSEPRAIPIEHSWEQ
jgi:hypothetical protein